VSPLAGPAVDKVVALIVGTPVEVAARYSKIMAPTQKK
jgi:hypothetical protein